MSDWEKIKSGLVNLGFDLDSYVDVCEDGSAWVGLVQILPPGSLLGPEQEEQMEVKNES